MAMDEFYWKIFKNSGNLDAYIGYTYSKVLKERNESGVRNEFDGNI